jgi:hypothetical protein
MGKNPFFFPSSSPLSLLGRRSPPAAHLARAPPFSRGPLAPSPLVGRLVGAAAQPSPSSPSPLFLSWAGQASAAQPGLFLPPPSLSFLGRLGACGPAALLFPARENLLALGRLAGARPSRPTARPPPSPARAGQLPSRRRLCAWGPPVSLAVVSCSSPTPTTPLSSLPIVPVARNRRRRIRSFDPAPR